MFFVCLGGSLVNSHFFLFGLVYVWFRGSFGLRSGRMGRICFKLVNVIFGSECPIYFKVGLVIFTFSFKTGMYLYHFCSGQTE